MTRVNLLAPHLLADQHLVAEIKELNQLSGSFFTSFHSKKGIVIEDIPKNFTLNTGHVKFFYNKGEYIAKRFQLLKEEALHRGFEIHAEFYNVWNLLNRGDLFNDWAPNNIDIQIVKDRIVERVISNPKSQKKDYWYRYNKKPISNSLYARMIQEESSELVRSCCSI